MAITNGSGAGRKNPHSNTSNNPSNQSLDDDIRQNAAQIVAFTTQSMILTNNTNGNSTNPAQMIV